MELPGFIQLQSPSKVYDHLRKTGPARDKQNQLALIIDFIFFEFDNCAGSLKKPKPWYSLLPCPPLNGPAQSLTNLEQLPESVVSAPTFAAFKNRLKSLTFAVFLH